MKSTRAQPEHRRFPARHSFYVLAVFTSAAVGRFSIGTLDNREHPVGEYPLSFAVFLLKIELKRISELIGL